MTMHDIVPALLEHARIGPDLSSSKHRNFDRSDPTPLRRTFMEKPIVRILAMAIVLCAMAVALSCDCLCGKKETAVPIPGQPRNPAAGEPWHFAVSGDSRNCGDVVMPAIAQGAAENNAQFYWHLGDLRAIYTFDEDMQQIAKLKNKPLNIIDYQNQAWDDFIENQIAPFGKIPFYLGIGNHETIPPKSREQFVSQFADWLDQPKLQEQRLQDNEEWRRARLINEKEKNRNSRQLKAYFHWKQGVVDFIYMDNASGEQFDAEQWEWFKRVANDDENDKSILTVVVGMHEALPWSISCDHSMNKSGEGERSGKKVYERLLALQKKKFVYTLASHSHFFMEGIFNTNYWLKKKNEGVLDGWIIGTGGAVRYRLPKNKDDAKRSETDVYGYLLGTVQPDGKIIFEFKKVDQHIPKEIKARYGADFVNNTCLAENKRPEPPKEPDFCAEVSKPGP
jgi:Calcineurin-like phosphoesterase